MTSLGSALSTMQLVDLPMIEFVQLDSLVVMKIVKHGDIEFYAGMSKIAGETCQGILTGLIAMEDRRLEVTNCFSTTRPDVLLEGEEAAQDAASIEESKNSEIIEMLKRFRTMNIDYEMVGFYQAHPFGACFNHEMLDSLVEYQIAQNGNGIVLIYDPIKTRQGTLTIRAYRLTRKALELAAQGDWAPESTKQAVLTFSSFFEELPIVVKNSHLMNVLMAELALSTKDKRPTIHLELGTKRSLERSLKALMGTSDELNKSVNAYAKYAMEKQKYDAYYNSLMQKRIAENEARQSRGEPPLSLDEIKRQLKQPQMQTRNGMLDLYLSALDTDAFSSFQIAATNENITKLHLSQAVSDQQKSVAAENAGGNMATGTGGERR